MITEAIYTIVSGITNMCEFFPLWGDISKEKNFGWYGVQKTPVRTKHDGIVGYNGIVNIGVINEDMETCETQSKQIIDAFEAISNQTIDNTNINHIHFTGDQYNFDPEEKLYYSELQFTYSSKNE